MTDTIKITALSQIGTNIPASTLTPVVDMAGTPTTKKATIANIANAILSEAGNTYAYAAKANIANVAGLAGVVSNAAQPNITSVGTLTGITSTGVANFTGASNVALGPVGNIRITGGSSGQVLSTNGTGTLSWVNQSGGGGTPGGSDGQVQFNDSGAFGGDAGLTFNKASNDLAVAGNVITESIQSPDGSNVTITAGTPGPAFIFTIGGALEIPGGHLLESNQEGEFELKSNQGLVISTDIANADLHFTFATDGQIYCPANANFQGTRVNIGPDSGNFELTDPTLVISASSNTYVQAGLINQNPIGSSDWVAYGANGSDAGAWTDFGFTGHDFDDPNYTITGEGDGYVFVQGYANGHGNSSLVLATGENGNVKDIIFATGGFTTANEFGKISHAENSLKLTRAGSSLEFADGTFAQDNIEGTGNFGFEMPANVGFGILANAGNSEWKFGSDGNLTTPSNLVIGANIGGGSSIYQFDAPLQVIGEGANSAVIVGWTANSSGPEDVVAIAFNNPLANGASNLVMGVGNNSTTVNYWTFANDGTTTFPTLTVDLHNGGNQTAQTLQFGDSTQQAIITGPTPSANINAQRLIIQGQRASGTGEGGDVYFWAGDADLYGGDIKIYAGDADNVSAGYGGYVNIEGGRGFDQGGYVRMTAGQSSNGQGAYAQIVGGYGVSGGDATVTGGYGSAGPGGNINLNAGQSGNGLSEYGNVNISAGASTWTLDNSGNTTIPGNLIAESASPAPYLSGFGTATFGINVVTTPVPYSTLVAVAGARAFINDGNLVSAGGGSFGAQVSGGGSNICPVWSDGTNWYIG